jgi:hypothetical protein
MSHLLLVNKLRSYHRFDTCQGTRKKLLLLQIMAKDKQIIWQLAMLRVLCSIFLPTQKVLRRRTLLRSCEITWRSQRQIVSLSCLSCSFRVVRVGEVSKRCSQRGASSFGRRRRRRIRTDEIERVCSNS